MDEPLNDPAALPLYLLMKHIAKEGYKVVLSGEGSDELFLGYRQYFEYLDIEKAATLHHKNWLKKYFHSHFSMNREWEWYKRIFDETFFFERREKNLPIYSKIYYCAKMFEIMNRFDFWKFIDENLKKVRILTLPIGTAAIDLKLFVGEHFLTKLDRMSMAHTLEARAPFLDHSLGRKYFCDLSPEQRLGMAEQNIFLSR